MANPDCSGARNLRNERVSFAARFFEGLNCLLAVLMTPRGINGRRVFMLVVFDDVTRTFCLVLSMSCDVF